MENYYRNRDIEVENLETMQLAAGKNIIICKDLKKGDKFHWFVHGDGDYGFGLFFSRDKNEDDIEE